MPLRYAFRTLAATPVVTVVAIVSMALGIGANTAIFSVFDQILLERLPVSHPEELVNLTSNGPRRGSDSENVAGSVESVFSYPMFRDLEKNQQSAFAGLAAHCSFGVNLAYQSQTSQGQSGQGQSESGFGMFVSGGYFPTLGLRPAAGRLLTPEDDRTPGAHRLVVLGHDYWTLHLGASP
jgi:hypothetical protein